MQAIVFNQLEKARARTLQMLEAMPEEIVQIVPEGFNNSILWQFGHILTIQERYTGNLTGRPLDIPADYLALFENGTKPADWKMEPPSLAVLRQQLAEQTARVQQHFAGRLEEKLAEPIRGMETFGEVLVSTIFHEGMHVGCISMLRRAASRQ
jgi:uncharacterized damage-inducible protein DinB